MISGRQLNEDTHKHPHLRSLRHRGDRGLQPARTSCGGVETDRAVLGDVDGEERNRLREDLPCT